MRDARLDHFVRLEGEISNSVFFGYSSKSHDGFIGNSVIGEWCNLGADTNNSNLKNNYSNIKLWNYEFQSFLILVSVLWNDYGRSFKNRTQYDD